jgi:amino acid transporter
MSVQQNSNSTKKMSTRSATFLGIGAMLGAGIFALLGQAGAVAGNAVWLSFLFGGLIAILLGYSFVKLGVRYPSRGGLIEFLAQEFGSGTLTGAMSVLTLWASIITVAMSALTFGSYVSMVLFGGTDYPAIAAKILGVLLVLVLTVVVATSAELMNKIQSVSVIVVMVVLTGVALLGLTTMDPANLSPAQWPPTINIIASLALTFFAYTGFQIITNSVEDMADPKSQLPRSIYISIAITILIYVLVSIMVYGNLTVDQVQQAQDTALAQAAEAVLGNLGAVLMVIAAVFATASTVNSNLYSGLNVAYALAIKGELPPRLAKPWKNASRGLITVAVISVFLVMFLDLTAIASVGSIVFLITYLLINIGHFRIRNETGGSAILLALGTLGTLVALVPFLIGLWETQRNVIWLTIVSVVVSVLLELYLGRVQKRKITPQTKTGSDAAISDA